MKNKALNRVFTSVLAAVLSVSMLPVSTLAATFVTPEPAQTGAAQIQVEYFTSTLFNWDQDAANEATKAADYKSDTYAWVNKQDATSNDHDNVLINFSDITTTTGVYQKTEYYVRARADNQYYPLVVSRTENENNLACVYRLYYDKGAEADGERYVWVDTWGGPATGDGSAQKNYPVDKPVYNNGQLNEFGNEGDNNSSNCGKIVYTVEGSTNHRVALYQYEPTNGVQEGKGFYFTQDVYIPDGLTKGTDYPTYSKWLGGSADPGDNRFPGVAATGQIWYQNFYIYSGIAAKDLKNSANVPFDNSVNAADLFGNTEYNWKDVYQNVQVPFYIDEDGYYVLDSDKYAVYLPNGTDTDKTGSTMNIADLPACYYVPEGYIGTGFQPFKTLYGERIYQATESASTNKVNAYAISGANNNNNNDYIDHTQDDVVYGFGMVTEVDFQMTDDGKDANGEDIIFEFSGDDDVWVYIDDKLVLDIGGTHDAVKGTVNFATGEVHLSSPAYGRLGDITQRANPNANLTDDEVNSDNITKNDLTQQNLYNKGNEAGVLNTTLTGFSAQGEHTLKIYYMDRGQGRTNCLIKFNLPQRDTIEVTKKFDNAKDNDGEVSAIDSDELASYGGREFGFTLYEDGAAVANKTYYVYDQNNTLIRTASTDPRGHFILKRNETARFLVDIGENNKFKVVEDEMTVDDHGFLTPAWTYNTNISGATSVDGTDFESMTVTATGSDTAADTISFVCENYLSSNVPNPGIRTQDDRIVIDYGLPITITYADIVKNDIIRGNNTDNTNITFVLRTTDGKFGTAELNGNDTVSVNDDTITYTLNKQLTGIETLTYYIKVTTTGNDGNVTKEYFDEGTGNILIMPATSMYYEENFGGDGTETTINDNPYVVYSLVKYSDGNTKWNSVGTAIGGNQETGIVNTIGDSTYGSDAVYLSNLGDSYGTSMMANADDEKAAMFEYDFTGTGTAIYGRVSKDTGYIRVTITADDETQKDKQYIDTRELASISGNNDEDFTLYNIPIYMNNTLVYGNYHVEVMLYKEGTPTTAGGSGAKFYLDGIRVYDPMGINDLDYDPTDENIIADRKTVASAYAEDDESNTVIVNIRDKIANDTNDAFTLMTLTDVGEGEIVVNEDGILTYPDGTIETLDEYAKYGPNNEFYLSTNATNAVYSVSFSLLNWNSQLYKIYLGMKSPAGTAATVNVGNHPIEINNSADCYYDISNYVVVETITETGEDGESHTYQLGTVTITGDSGLVSLTNIKVTGVDGYEIVDGTDVEATGNGSDGGTEASIVYNARTLYLVPTTFSMTSTDDEIEIEPDETEPEETEPDETEPEETEPEESTEPDESEEETDSEETDETIEGEVVPGDEEDQEEESEEEPDYDVEVDVVPDDDVDVEVEVLPEDEVFTPDQFRADCSYSKSRKTATITIYASKDVSSVTVDGDEIFGVKLGNSKIFIDVHTRVNSGTTYEVVAYDRDGNASEVYTVTAD